MPERKLANWILGWEEYTAPLPSPELWRKWGGIGVIAAALERKVWVTTGMGALYPNLYIVNVGPPGLGKTVVSKTTWEFLNSLSDGTDKGLHLASSSVTFASVIDELAEAKRDIVRLDMDPARYEFNALTIVSNELGVLLPEYDAFMMPKLTDLYDGHPYSERRRTNDTKIKLEAPQLNLIASCTPAYLTTTLPPAAWDQGFLSRMLIAFSTENLRREIFSEIKKDTTLKQDLLTDLKLIFKSDFTFGEMSFTTDAQAKLERWHHAGGPPAPDHPKLMHYLTRRTTQVIKLSMIASIAESSSLKITDEHLMTAIAWLLELETYLPDIFKAMVAGGDAQVMREAWYYFASEYAKTHKPIPEHKVIAYLSTRLPAHSVVRVLDVMEKAQLMKKVFEGTIAAWKPQGNKGGDEAVD